MEASIIEVLPQLTKLAEENGVTDLKATLNMAYVYQNGIFREDQPGFAITGEADPEKSTEKENFIKKADDILTGKGITYEADIKANFKGKKFPTLKSMKPVFQPDMPSVELTAKEGEVTLFDFWATWCGPCQPPMAHNQKMLEEHPEWVGKVRIVAVSIDDGPEAPKKRAEDKNWKKVEHYWAEGAWGSDACKKFGINGIPFCVLVDKTGIIRMVGHPASMKLDTNLVKLAENNTLEGGDAEEDGKGNELKDKTYTYAQCKTDLEKFVKDHETDLSAVTMPLFACVFALQAKDGGMEAEDAFLVVRFKWFSEAKEKAENIKKDLNEIFGKKMIIKMQDIEKKKYKLSYGTKCEKCGKSLVPNTDQYVCVLCKPEVYLCPECVESHKDPQKLEDLPHPHGLYLIQKESASAMEHIELGDLKQGSGSISEKVHDSCRCDFCGATPSGIRWKCANCPSVDACDKCVKMAKNPADPGYGELITKAKAQNHDMNIHVYVRQEFVQFVKLPY